MKAIVGGTVIDGTGRDPIADGVLVIDGERIVQVGRRGQVSYPPDAEVIDVTGQTVLPGLIDCHDHLASLGYDMASRLGITWHPSYRTFLVAQVLRQTLEAGFTTIREAGGLDVGMKQAVEEGLVPGPRLIVSLSIISPTGGIADHITPSGLLLPAGPGLPSGVADGVEAVRRKVRELVRNGADVIKMATTGGVSSRPGHGPKDIEYTADEVRAIVEEAHALGRRVMCHALGGPGLRMAVEAGVDSIEHGGYLDEDPDLIRMMADKGIFYVPTYSVYVYHRRQGAPYMQERGKEMYPHHVASLQQALAAGVSVAMGTDAGGYVHGNNALELECLVEAGMTPMQAVVATTRTAAQCIGLEKELGTLEPGRLADLVVVDGDPLRDVKILQEKARMSLVMKGGQIYVDRLSEPR